MKINLKHTKKNKLSIVKLITSLKMLRIRMYQQKHKWKFLFLIIFIFPITTYLYASHIETKSLSITWTDIKNPNIPEGFRNIKIVQFSDTHFGPNFSHKQQKMLIDQINEVKPDIVVFTGDLIDKFSEYTSDRKYSQTILTQINAPLGKYAVFGNHDRGGGGGHLYEQYMEEAGFTVLVNETIKIKASNGDYITISGLDDFLLGKPKVQHTLQHLQEKDFNILLVHEPDAVDEVLEYPVDFQLSGHSHGGQVQLPFMGPIITTSLAKQYVEGMYSLQGKSKPLQLYVNRGIGTTRMPIRFWSRPELSVFVLKN